MKLKPYLPLKIKNPLYVKFKDGSIYQIHDTRIEIIVNQNLNSSQHIEYTGGINSEETPFKLQNYCFVTGEHRQYLLTFKNKLFGEIARKFEEPFVIDNMEFRVSEINNKGIVRAIGHEIPRN